MDRTHRGARAVVAPIIAVVILLSGLGGSGAQVTPGSHPAFIYRGTCAELGEVAYPLTPILSTEFATPATVSGAETAYRTSSSVTTLDVSLTALLTSPHAIAVRQSSPDVAQNIVCGDVGGIVTNDELAVGLREVDGSGDVGLAVLESVGAQTRVTVYLAHALGAVSTMPGGRVTTVEVTLEQTRITATQTAFQVGSTYSFNVTNLTTIENEMAIVPVSKTDQPLVSGDSVAAVYAIPPGQSKTLTWTFTEMGSYLLTSLVPAPFDMRTYLEIDVRPLCSPGTQPDPVPPPEPVACQSPNA